MSAQRHNSDREATGAVERMWQTYADELGIPGAESHDALAPLTAAP